MRPCRIQLSGVTSALLMLLLLSGASTLLPTKAFAQPTASSCGGTIQTQTVSTTVPNLAPNTTNNISIPQYDYTGSGFSLISAVITSSITTHNTVTFTNVSPSEQFFDLGNVTRSDLLKFGATTLGGGSAVYTFPFTDLDVAGSPDDAATYGPTNFFSNTKVVTDSVTTLQPVLNSFLGNGMMSFSYKNTNFYNNIPVPQVTEDISETDDITLTVKYYFCNPIVLSSNIITFTATREDDQTVAVNWITGNEQPGRRYDIEVSSDGRNYTIADSRPSDPVNNETSYQYNYPIPNGATGKLYFRLQQVEASGLASYSPVRVIDLNGAGTPRFSIYPNPPSDFVQLTFPVTSQGWQVDILAADGSLVQRNLYSNSNQARVNFARKLAAGAYFVRATDSRTATSYVASFVIR